MPNITLDTTPGGPLANSYCSLIEANAYHDGHPYASAWTAASNDQRNRALVTATRMLDEQWDWYGWVRTDTQCLAWPRSGMYYASRWYIPDDVIPVKLKEATAEFARQLLVADRAADDSVSSQGISSITAGPISIDFSGSVKEAKVIPDAVFVMLTMWGTLRRRTPSSVSLVRT